MANIPDYKSVPREIYQEWEKELAEDKIRINSPFKPPSSISYIDLIKRLVGNKFEINIHYEDWMDHSKIMHIALRNAAGQIVRFEENPEVFPSPELIDKLRLLR